MLDLLKTLDAPLAYNFANPTLTLDTCLVFKQIQLQL